MRKTQLKKPPTQTPDMELRRWCIEHAIRWPTEHYGNAVYSQGGGIRGDADVIGRAEKLLKWVKASA